MSETESATLICRGCGRPIAVLSEGALVIVINSDDWDAPCPLCDLAEEQIILDYFEGKL